MSNDNKLILLMVEDDPHIFTGKEKMISFLLANEDEQMNNEAVEQLITEGAIDTNYASYSWDYCPVD